MTEIFYTVNAGLYMSSGNTAILIDGIHEGPSIGFSDMPSGLLKQLFRGSGMFARLDGLLFTHLHPDHYDAGKVRLVLESRSGTALWGPGLTNRGLSELEESADCCTFRIGDFHIFAYVTEHSGPSFADYPHRSFLIRNECTGESFFVSGDAIFRPELADTVIENAGGQRVTAAFINIYHLIEKPSRDFLLRLAPGRLLLYHRPLPGDDVHNYLFVIDSTLRRNLLPGYDILQPAHMSRVQF